jgi:hypothetical protein
MMQIFGVILGQICSTFGANLAQKSKATSVPKHQKSTILDA